MQVKRTKSDFSSHKELDVGRGMIDMWRHRASDTTAATCRGRGQALADWLPGDYTWLWQLKTRDGRL